MCEGLKPIVSEDHFDLLFSLGFATALQEAQRRVGKSDSTMVVVVVSEPTPKGSVSEGSHREWLLLAASSAKHTVSKEPFLSLDECKARSISPLDAVFYQVSQS